MMEKTISPFYNFYFLYRLLVNTQTESNSFLHHLKNSLRVWYFPCCINSHFH